MEYRANLVPMGKMPDPEMIKEGTLCDRCVAYDCSNPIVKLTISVLGINKRMKVWKTNTNRFAVVACEGFRSDTVSMDEEDYAENQ
jgi:hypothetical protein